MDRDKYPKIFKRTNERRMREYKSETLREYKELRKSEVDENIHNLQIVSIFLIGCYVYRIIGMAQGVEYVNTGFLLGIIGLFFLIFWYVLSLEWFDKTTIKKVVYMLFWLCFSAVALIYLRAEIMYLESFGYYLMFFIIYCAFFIAPIKINIVMSSLNVILSIVIIHISDLSDYKKVLFINTMVCVSVIAIIILQVKFKSFVSEKKAVLALKSVSEIDLLTNLLNRRGMEEEMKRQWNFLKDTQKKVIVIMLDIDFFKSYNDTYGHIAGDNCLKIISKCIYDTSIEYTDLIVRYGGEEFVVIINDKMISEALEIAKKIKDAIENLKIEAGTTSEYTYVTVSIGIGSVVASDSNNAYTAIDIADEQLYHSKFTGRNKITVEAVKEWE